MALEMEARMAADTLADIELEEQASMLARRSDTPTELRQAYEQLNDLIAHERQRAQRLSGLEEAARIAIDTVSVTADQRLGTVVERAETRIVEAVSLSEQSQHEIARWREDIEQRLRTRLRELGEWDEILTEKRTELDGMREMAEAAMSLASGDLDTRWEGVRSEFYDTFATFESDERARWEAFMATAADTIAAGEGGDPAVIENLRGEVVRLQDHLQRTANALQQQQQQQREATAALRTELHSLLENAHQRTLATVEQSATDVNTQITAFREWHQKASEEHGRMTVQFQSAITQARASSQSDLSELHSEIEQMMMQTRAAASTETGSIRLESDRALFRLQRQMRAWHSITFVLAIIAIVVGIGAFIVAYLHI